MSKYNSIKDLLEDEIRIKKDRKKMAATGNNLFSDFLLSRSPRTEAQ